MKFCKDCKHFSDSNFSGAKCCRSESKEIDLVYGDPVSAGVMRTATFPCGPDALLFEPKTEGEK